MRSTRRRVLGAGIAAGALAAFMAGAPAVAKDKPTPPVNGQGQGPLQSIQLLSFNDYHGHLEAVDEFGDDDIPAGGSEYLANALESLRAKLGEVF